MDVFDLTIDQVFGLGDKGCCKTQHPFRPCPCDSKLFNLLGLGASNKYKVTGVKIYGGDVYRLIMVLLEHLSEIQCGLDVALQARHMVVLHLTVGKILDLGDKGRSRTMMAVERDREVD